MVKKIVQCRACGNRNLELVLDLGEQMLTGVFPKSPAEAASIGPLHLVKCSGDGDVCGLLQLEHSYDLEEMYGSNYGYRSGLNASMVAHLRAKVARIIEHLPLSKGDLVVDIGSNDATTLRAYPDDLLLVGIDPTGVKFKQYYPSHVQLIPEFFSTDLLTTRFPGRKAKVVTSFSMFYDLEDPMNFMREIHSVLADDGVWVFEQSYMPSMLDMNSYDTVCHEHLEFYGLSQIKWMADRVGFNIQSVELNGTNGGSISVTVAKSNGATVTSHAVQEILDEEARRGLNTLTPYRAFAKAAEDSKRELREFVARAQAEGKTVAALGASTKGNVLLQYCGLSHAEISCIGEVNDDKFGSYTPGTWIPIVSESELLARKPDYVIVLPWHFRAFFESVPSLKDVALVFPLPKFQIVTPSKSAL